MKINDFTILGLLAISLLFSSMVIPVQGQVRDCVSTLITRVDADYNGPVFLDSYWTDRSASSTDTLNPIELEVGVDEGPSTLAVVLVNRSPLELYAVTGYLKLPDEFKPSGISASPEAKAYFDSVAGRRDQNVAYSSHYDTLSEGEVFTLYFDVNVGPEAKIGTYAGSLIVDYSTPEYVRSCKSALLTVPFVLPGKVILDLTTDGKQLSPKVSNNVNFIIKNEGDSPATGVVATIQNIGDNSGGSSRSGSSVTLQSSDTDLVNLGPTTFNIGTIPPNDSVTITTQIFPEITAAATVQNVDMQITYGNAYGYKQTSVLTTGIVVLPRPAESSLLISYDSQNTDATIVAGKVRNIDFEVTNNGLEPMTNLLLSTNGESEELKIIGNAKWAIDMLEPGETTTVTTGVFASTNLINIPTYFVFTADFITNGESKTESVNVGTFVSGNIDLQLYDLEVTNISGQMYVVGNILNQGSTTGKFASIELLSYPSTQSKTPEENQITGEKSGFIKNSIPAQMPPQFLGDLTEDSSIPFSIQLPIQSLSPGEYPFTFKIRYADDLRNFQDIVFDENVSVSKIKPQGISGGRENQPSADSMPIVYAAIIVSIIAVTAALIVIKRKKTQKQLGNTDDLDFLLENSKEKKK
jgi:hypothetical protein